ncbi:MAG TPA: serine/threonine-protein kinase [Polyangia bacterium]|nr:serine/threonine-protein kinase [Polyangia bacterium]
MGLTGVVPDPLVGQVLSQRYRIIKKLGEGAMGGVYLAEHLGVGATIVLKVLLPELANDQNVVDSFLREARIAAEIHDDNVIDIFYSGRADDGQVYLAMEYVEGATLYDILEKEGPLPWARAKPLLAQLASALAASHACGIIHRDVKPENVLVGHKDGPSGPVEFVKLSDFGIASAPGNIGGAEGVCGTPEFMPPEQAQGQPPDARDDIYAFGGLMYQVLTGDVPFRADDVARALLMHLRDPVMPPRQRRPDLVIPSRAQDVVMRALEKKRDDRWQEMSEVQQAIDYIPVEEEVVVNMPTVLEPKRTISVATEPARARIVMPKEHGKWRTRLPLVVGGLLVVGACAFAFIRHAILHAPGRIEITTEPVDAEIFIDGQKMADRSPMFLDASPGSYSVIVRSAGFETLSQTLIMKPSDDRHVLLALTALPPPPPAPTPAHHAASAAAPRRHAAPSVNGVTFIDFKKSAAAQNGH